MKGNSVRSFVAAYRTAWQGFLADVGLLNRAVLGALLWIVLFSLAQENVGGQCLLLGVFFSLFWLGAWAAPRGVRGWEEILGTGFIFFHLWGFLGVVLGILKICLWVSPEIGQIEIGSF